jgi:superfamily II DNA or RNA helicase
MTREEARDEILSIENPNILCELPTSFGKTKVALDLMKSRVKTNESIHILIVVPRVILKDNWKDEFIKWNMQEYLPYVEFITYVSLPKKAGTWDMVIFDEVHHLSERCRDAISSFKIKYATLLSATINREMRRELNYIFSSLYTYKVTTKQAIKEEILPDPRVYLIPLTLDNIRIDFEIIKNKTQKTEVVIPYSQRFNYARVKNKKVIIKCTQRQYYDDMSSLIEWYKKKVFNEACKNLFLRKSGERLKWLSDQKSNYIKTLLDKLYKQRTLTFCNGIPQTEELGKYCINSKNKASEENLQKFNKGIINHITACNMLDEGMNLTNCRVGVYAVLNSSERMIKQKLGRLLRHKDPIIIIPYFKGTREEELVAKMLEDYNPELVTKLTSLTELKL